MTKDIDYIEVGNHELALPFLIGYFKDDSPWETCGYQMMEHGGSAYDCGKLIEKESPKLLKMILEDLKLI